MCWKDCCFINLFLDRQRKQYVCFFLFLLFIFLVKSVILGNPTSGFKFFQLFFNFLIFFSWISFWFLSFLFCFCIKSAHVKYYDAYDEYREKNLIAIIYYMQASVSISSQEFPWNQTYSFDDSWANLYLHVKLIFSF